MDVIGTLTHGGFVVGAIAVVGIVVAVVAQLRRISRGDRAEDQ